MSFQLPPAVFQDFMSPLTEGDAEGMQRDATTGWLIPTKKTSACRRFKYTIRRGSVSNRLFHLESMDPAPKPAVVRSSTVETVQIGEENVYEVESILESRMKGTKKEYFVKWLNWPSETNPWEPSRNINPALIAAFDGTPAPAPPRESRVSLPKRGAGCARAHFSAAAARRGEVPQMISMVCGNVHVEYMESVKEAYMPKGKIVFQVLTMDKAGHIMLPTDFAPATRAALRMQARALLRKMIDDPLSPVDSTMEPALTGVGTDSVFKPAPKRRFVEVEE